MHGVHLAICIGSNCIPILLKKAAYKQEISGSAAVNDSLGQCAITATTSRRDISM